MTPAKGASGDGMFAELLGQADGTGGGSATGGDPGDLSICGSPG